MLSKSLIGFKHFSCECYRIKAPQLLQGKKQEARFLFPLNMSGSINSFFTKTVQLQLFREKKMLYNHHSLVVPFFFSQIFHVIKKYLSKKSVIYVQLKCNVLRAEAKYKHIERDSKYILLGAYVKAYKIYITYAIHKRLSL